MQMNDMKGVDFITDDKGEKKAVVIDLKKNAEVWEDFYDGLLSKNREKEERISLDVVKKNLKSKSD